MAGFVLVLAAALGVGTASAHSVTTGSNPAPESSVDAGPERVEVQFNEALQTQFASLTVVGPDGNLWTKSDPRVEGNTVSADLGELGPAGEYTIAYRVTSADGHPVSGTIPFTLTTEGSGTPGAAADAAAAGDDEGGGGVPLWPFVVGAVVIVAAGVFFALRKPKS
ncbi:copper resistance protein [Rhodococcus rhodnii LMG 5362]|uniref:Copper resistance protein n=1 Tax=Rhodococcus rhodnii LMG 5362 TaxID=1273125 RepID=R7WGX3_9NOCA|nr:copper resistance protein [Rhodococcus rhodnii LMG 5362]